MPKINRTKNPIRKHSDTQEARSMFGELFQLGHVVPDVNAAVDEWAAIGIGPWRVVTDYPVEEWVYRGARVTIPIDVALAWSGGVQIELIAPRDRAPSMYREFLAANPQGGLQHLGYRSADYQKSLGAGLAAGWTVWLSGLVNGGMPFCYLRPPPGSRLLPVEVSQRA